MRTGLYLIAGLLAAVAGAGRAAAQIADDAVHRRITASGFIPLEEMTFGGRDVRRVLPIDPYGFLPIPGMELERHKDGRATLRAQYRGWTGPAYPVSPDEWDRLAALEPAAFAPPDENSFKSRPGVVVHCWSGLVEASPSKGTSWWACNSGTRASQAYTEAVLDLAIKKKGCPSSDKDALWRFSECFTDAGALADPVLQKQFAAFRDRWEKQREPGVNILAEARRSLRAAKDRLPYNLTAARLAVFAFGQQQDALREILRASFSAFPESGALDARSATILAQARRGWDEDIKAQNRNYIELLEELARLLAVGGKPPS